MCKVLVTGANGFLGSHLSRELYRRGYEVKVMIRPKADVRTIADVPCEVFYGEIHQKEDVVQAVSGCQVVIHEAAITEQQNISYDEYEKINFLATRHVAD